MQRRLGLNGFVTKKIRDQLSPVWQVPGSEQLYVSHAEYMKVLAGMAEIKD